MGVSVLPEPYRRGYPGGGVPAAASGGIGSGEFLLGRVAGCGRRQSSGFCTGAGCPVADDRVLWSMV